MRVPELLLAAALVAAAVLSSPVAAQERAREGGEQRGLGIRLLDVPDERRDDPRAHSYIVDHLAPGAEIARRIEVINHGAEPVTLEAYAAAAQVRDGRFIPADGREGNDLTSWTTVEPASLTLQGGASGIVSVRLVVPRDAAAGERYAAVLVEAPPTQGAGGVGVVSRIGVRMYVSVGAGAEPAAAFRVEGLRGWVDDGGVRAFARVENVGGRALDLVGELELLDGPGGLSAGPIPVTVTTVAVGESRDVAIPLDERIPEGPWRGVLTLRSGSVERRVEATGLVFAAAEVTEVPLTEVRTVANPEAPPGAATGWGASAIGGLVVVVAAAAGLLGAVTVHFRRRD